jgi:RNA polymerase sigma-70 factor, ECF subfamily
MTAMTALPAGESGAAERFEELYRSCAGDVYAYVASLLRDRSAAEDVTALAFERAYRRRALFDVRRGSPRSWLFAIARNAALDELRRRKRSAATLLYDPADEAAAVEADDLAAETLAERRLLVRDGLAALDAREREVILLKFLGRLSNAELARVLRCSESNAGTRLHRAIQRLREECGVTR